MVARNISVKSPWDSIFYSEVPDHTVFRVHTDGGCHNSGKYSGIGAWAYHIQKLENGVVIKTLKKSKGIRKATNNSAELLAVINALKTFNTKKYHKEPFRIRIVSDSQYVVKGATCWLSGWKLKNFKNVANSDLWRVLDSLDINLNTFWQWTRGHSNNPQNNMVDRMCTMEINKLKRKMK